MEILTEEEMAMRIDYRAPLQKEDPNAIPPKQSVYAIPFEYGENRKGTVISVALAKQIAAELRAEIAEWDKQEIFRAFKEEQARSSRIADLSAAKETELFEARSHIVRLESELRKVKKLARSGTYGKKR